MTPILIRNSKLYSFKKGTKLPEKPIPFPYETTLDFGNVKHGRYEKAKREWLDQLESLALPIEEGSVERVENLLPTSAWTLNKETGDDELIPGLYHIEAKFKVRIQIRKNKLSEWMDGWPLACNPPFEIREVMRLVERKEVKTPIEESQEGLWSDFWGELIAEGFDTENCKRVQSKFIITRKPE
jgi:hypothetical protein